MYDSEDDIQVSYSRAKKLLLIQFFNTTMFTENFKGLLSHNCGTLNFLLDQA